MKNEPAFPVNDDRFCPVCGTFHKSTSAGCPPRMDKQKKQKYINLYFPIVDFRPGIFDGDQISYADNRNPIQPVRNISTIKSQIIKSIQFRTKNRFQVKQEDYTYQRIKIDISMLSVRAQEPK